MIGLSFAKSWVKKLNMFNCILHQYLLETYGNMFNMVKKVFYSLWCIMQFSYLQCKLARVEKLFNKDPLGPYLTF